MGFKKMMDKVLKRLDVWDIGLIKWCVLFFTLFLAKVWPWLLGWSWYVYLIIAVLLMIRPIRRGYFPKAKSKK